MAQMLGWGLRARVRSDGGRHRDRHGREHDGDNPQLEKRTQYLALLSNIATLFGLLGTIMGLIDAFTAVAGANPARRHPSRGQYFDSHELHRVRLMSAIRFILHARMTTATGNIVNSLEMAM